jgi:hypothetical protein
MSSARIALAALPLFLLAACAGMSGARDMQPPPAPTPVSVAPSASLDTARAQFIAAQREEARRLEANFMLSQARQHWRYILAVSADDADARQQIARLDALIRTRRDAALAQGETAMRRGRTAEAQTAFLRVLALDGANEQARRRLLEIETRAAFARQDRKDARARAGRTSGTETPEDE